MTNHAHGAVRWHDGTNIRQMVDMVAATVQACTDDQVVAYDADADLFYCKADADSGGATALNNIGDASADGTIAAGGYETTITSTLDEADHSVLTIYNNDADRANDTTLLTLKDDDGADANAFYLKMIGDADGTPATQLSVSQTAITTTLAFVSTGTISGAIPIQADADGRNLTAAECYGYLHVATGAGTWLLPAAAAGMNLCVLVTGASDVIIDIDASDDITLVGVQDTDGDGITNASGSSSGDFVCLVAIDDTHWYVMGKQGTWAAQ